MSKIGVPTSAPAPTPTAKPENVAKNYGPSDTGADGDFGGRQPDAGDVFDRQPRGDTFEPVDGDFSDDDTRDDELPNPSIDRQAGRKKLDPRYQEEGAATVEDDPETVIQNLRRELAEREGALMEQPITMTAEQVIVTPEEISEAFKTEEGFGDFIHSVIDRTQQSILKKLPEIIAAATNRQASTQGQIQAFYETHPQLKEFAGYVGGKTRDIAAQNPEWPIKRVLEEAATQSYAGLRIKKVAQDREDVRRKQSNPGFARRPTAPAPARGATNRNGIASEIDEMLNL